VKGQIRADFKMYVWRGQSVNQVVALQPVSRGCDTRIAGARNPAMAPASWAMSELNALLPPGQGHRSHQV
jgi:hypothetical protein